MSRATAMYYTRLIEVHNAASIKPAGPYLLTTLTTMAFRDTHGSQWHT